MAFEVKAVVVPLPRRSFVLAMGLRAGSFAIDSPRRVGAGSRLRAWGGASGCNAGPCSNVGRPIRIRGWGML